MAEALNVVNALTQLKPIGHIPSEVEVGTVQLFHHPSFDSPRHILRIHDWTQGEHFLLDSGFIDTVTWVAWNLPIGTVVTLTDHHQSRQSQGIGSLYGQGGSVDLVGNGQVQSTDLRDCGMNDIAASWFWREVDLKYGAFEMFEHPDFTGIRVTIFLSEWPASEYVNIPGWHINDTMTALRWKALLDKQRVNLWEHPDGKGNSFNNVKGWGSSKEVADLRNVGFNDCVSCFRWEPMLPVKEIIQPIIIASSGNDMQQVGDTLTYDNNGTTEQSVVFSVKKTTSQTLTIATTDSHVFGVKTALKLSGKAGVPLVAEGKAEWSLELSYQYTHSKTTTASTTETVEINVQHNVKAAPKGRTEARLIAALGKVPETWYTTTATRWYNEPLSGSSRDDSPEGQGKYKREESITVRVSGGLVSSTKITTNFTPF